MAGMIIERRDQVLMTFLDPASFWTTTLRSRCSSTKGPFLRLRGIFCSYLLALLAGRTAADDELVALLVGVARAPLGLTPRRHRVRSEEHTSELQSLMRNSYAVFCLKKKN